jgi:hypothetical protein
MKSHLPVAMALAFAAACLAHAENDTGELTKE